MADKELTYDDVMIALDWALEQTPHEPGLFTCPPGLVFEICGEPKGDYCNICYGPVSMTDAIHQDRLSEVVGAFAARAPWVYADPERGSPKLFSKRLLVAVAEFLGLKPGACYNFWRPLRWSKNRRLT